MKIKKFKKIFSLLLCCVLFVGAIQFAAFASESGFAASTDFRGSETYIKSYNTEYKGFSILTVGDGFKATTQIYVTRTLTSIPPVYTKYLGYQARLFSSTGLVASSKIEKVSTDYLPAVSTTVWRGAKAFSRGFVEYKSNDGKTYSMVLNPAYPSSRNAILESAILESLRASLNENNFYPVNRYGESYGSALLADIVGEDPDLILAVGNNGLSGYVRADELKADYDVPPEDNVTISVYDLDGLVIDTFVLNGHEVDVQ